MSDLFFFAGALFILIACIGINNLPDVLCRAHALSKALTLGIILMLLGLAFHVGLGQASFKIFLAIAFQLFTIPVAAHLFALLAYRKRILTKEEDDL